ncbi:conserved protein, unknown function [Hepatocystis sp. ex Piliocolobus tephrosceles]|nr:conserved protein, unknown function [Hepatocystis sp. ex Piliocolobus tephrosceles]
MTNEGILHSNNLFDKKKTRRIYTIDNRTFNKVIKKYFLIFSFLNNINIKQMIKNYNYCSINKKHKYKNDLYNYNFHKNINKRNHVVIYMILAPKGSIHEEKTKHILSDPINNYPWEISIPFHETITKELSPYYNFLKCEWAYLNHKNDKRRSCGKIEGGLENYTGHGLQLEKGKDRQRYEHIPYYDDHGVEWRNINKETDIMSFDIQPDGNQDVSFLETEEDIENRQWGNWNYSCSKETTQLNSVWRDPVLSKDLSNMIYPWTHKSTENHIIPFGFPTATTFIPDIKIEWELAARGFFGGYFEDPNYNRIKFYKIMKKLILDWHQLSQLNEINKSKQNQEESTKKKKKKKTEQLLLTEITNITKKIDKIKIDLFGTSGNIFNKKINGAKQIKLINQHALLRAKNILLDHILNPNNDPDYIKYYLDKHEPLDYIGGGNHKCTEEEIKDKTIALNMVVFPMKQQIDSYSYNMSISEMAEMYHYYMTEINGQGRSHQTFEDVVEDKYLCYELKEERKKFPALVSLYKPLWTNIKYGEEFGQAITPSHKLELHKLNKFMTKLKKKKKIYINLDKQSSDSHDHDQYNYIDDYAYVDEEYDF